MLIWIGTALGPIGLGRFLIERRDIGDPGHQSAVWAVAHELPVGHRDRLVRKAAVFQKKDGRLHRRIALNSYLQVSTDVSYVSSSLTRRRRFDPN